MSNGLELVGELAGGILRFIGRLLLEIVFEFLIKGVGYLLCRPFSRKKLDPDSASVAVVGLAFWAVVGIGVYFLTR